MPDSIYDRVVVVIRQRHFLSDFKIMRTNEAVGLWEEGFARIDEFGY